MIENIITIVVLLHPNQSMKDIKKINNKLENLTC